MNTNKENKEDKSMCKKLSTCLAIYCVIVTNSFAGVIVHQDYNPGDTITAAKQNSNENTIYNEFNGNIDNTNIKSQGVQASNVANNTLGTSQFQTTVNSTFTYVNNLRTYRRPALKYTNNHQLTIETGLDGVSGDGVILFPDGVRIVDSTSGHITLEFNQVANLGASPQGGLFQGTKGTNTWFAVYAVKANSATNFVLVGDTTSAITASLPFLNNEYGVNGWVYLGLARIGDNAGSTTDLLRFVQQNAFTIFTGTTNVNSSSLQSSGINLATTASATSLTYTYASGMGNQIPPNLNFVQWAGCSAPTNSTTTYVTFADSISKYSVISPSDKAPVYQRWWNEAGLGVVITNSATTSLAMDVLLTAWIDPNLNATVSPSF